MKTNPTPKHDDVRRHIVNSLIATAQTRTLDDPLAIDELEQAIELATTWEGKTRPGLGRELFDAVTLKDERLTRRAQMRAVRRCPTLSEAL